METKKVFEETAKIGNEVKKMKEYYNKLSNRAKKLKDECSHEIVFKYNDNHPRKMYIDGNYFCPACGKTITCINFEDIRKSFFKNSRIIPLLDLSLIATKETYSAIRKEVYENMDYYYNTDNDIEDLSIRMEIVLQDLEYDYHKERNSFTKK